MSSPIDIVSHFEAQGHKAVVKRQIEDGYSLVQLTICDADSCTRKEVGVKQVGDQLVIVPVKSLNLKANPQESIIDDDVPMPDGKTQWVIYSIDNCHYCDQAKAILKARGEPCVEYNCDNLKGGKKNATDVLAG
jgi:hypothetical protein